MKTYDRSEILQTSKEEFEAFLAGMGRGAELLRHVGKAAEAQRIRLEMIRLRQERKLGVSDPVNRKFADTRGHLWKVTAVLPSAWGPKACLTSLEKLGMLRNVPVKWLGTAKYKMVAEA